MASQPSPSADELFERWVRALPEGRRAALAEHIAIARTGAAWMRVWLPTVEPGVHIMSAADFAEWDPSEDELLSAEDSAAVLAWMETGEGPCPWPPPASRS